MLRRPIYPISLALLVNTDEDSFLRLSLQLPRVLQADIDLRTELVGL
jgi:hypothetical protein